MKFKSLLTLSFVFVLSMSIADSHAQEKSPEDELIKKDQPLKSQIRQTPIVRAGDIYASCQHHFENQFNTSENISKRASCNGYFFGIGGILVLLQNEGASTKTCVPDQISAHDLTKIFLKWAKDPKNDLNIAAPEATLLAIRNEYKCN
jgi:hypothetical protein